MTLPLPNDGHNTARPDNEAYNSDSGAPQERGSDNDATIKNQVDKFTDAARATGADESEDHFRARLCKIAKAKAVSGDAIEEKWRDDQKS